MEKRQEAAFFVYFALLLLLVITTLGIDIVSNIVSFVYMVVVLCCSLKVILIVNKDNK